MRACGVLMPIFSLPSYYGIGTLGSEAIRFADQMKEAGQSYWQVLPMGPTGFGDSPYQSYSTFAGSPYYIDLEQLIEDELLTEVECEEEDFGNGRRVAYDKLYNGREKLLKKAFLRSNFTEEPAFAKFEEENDWLNDYAMFMAIRKTLSGLRWDKWPENIRTRQPKAMAEYADALKEEILFEKFMQYLFYQQWQQLKEHTAEIGLKLIGDLPIYVAYDSADCWTEPELFQFDKDLQPKAVAGCPPDPFAKKGQLWGNPIYDWKRHKKDGFQWWIKRMKHAFGMFDLVRIDHFRGFDEYYAIPFGDEDAVNGTWMPGPGNALFKAMKKELGELPVIAEDLGFLTPTVRKLLADTAFPGMKVLQFAFGVGKDNDYLPHNHIKNSVVYTGTHDNQTTAAWIKEQKPEDLTFIAKYLNHGRTTDTLTVRDMICAALGSCSDLAIIPIQDYLELGDEARINIPGTAQGNWNWRMKRGAITKAVIAQMREDAEIYIRVEPTETEKTEPVEPEEMIVKVK